MTDQLSLRLEPELPRPPRTLRPMLARPIPEPFDSDAHLFEPAWGGRRALVFIEPADRAGAGDVHLVDEDGRPISPLPRELEGLAVRVDARSAVLDGELVVVDPHGRLDRPELDRRLRGEPGRPVAFLAFDVLHVDGRSMLSVPLAKRRDALRRILRPGDEVVTVPAIPAEGRALFAAVVEQGLAGVRARQAASPYLPGLRSRLWRFIAVEGGRTGAARGRASDDEASAAGGGEAEEAGRQHGHGGGAVLAVFRRLPLDLGDADAPPDRPDGGVEDAGDLPDGERPPSLDLPG